MKKDKLLRASRRLMRHLKRSLLKNSLYEVKVWQQYKSIVGAYAD